MALNPREKVIAVCVGVVAGLLVLDQVLLTPYLDRLSRADADVADRQQGIADANNVLQARIKLARHWRDISGNRVKADAPSAESQPLNRFAACAQDAGLPMSTLKPEKGDREKGYDRLVLRTTGQGSMAQISRFLYALQTTDIPIKVVDVQIKATKEGTDALQLDIGVATIFQGTPPARVAQAFSPREAVQ